MLALVLVLRLALFTLAPATAPATAVADASPPLPRRSPLFAYAEVAMTHVTANAAKMVVSFIVWSFRFMAMAASCIRWHAMPDTSRICYARRTSNRTRQHLL